MQAVLHENPENYEAEYRHVRGALVTKGTTLNEWLIKNGINRQLACAALRGQSFGPKARALRARILREVLGDES